MVKTRFWITLGLSCVMALVMSFCGPLMLFSTPDVAAAFPPLSKGVNLSSWFSTPHEDNFPKAYLNTWVRESDFKQIADMGADHVRLPIDPEFLQSRSAPYSLLPERLKYIDRAIDWAGKYDLDIVLDIHPLKPLNLEAGKEAEDYEALQKLWQGLATRYKSQPRTVLYELLNEPQVQNSDAWRKVVEGLVDTIRQVDRSRILLIAGSRWSAPQDLAKVTPISDPRVIYTFHFYLPMEFTHQGANWAGKLEKLRGIPYPYNHSRLMAASKRIRNPQTANFLDQYEEDQYNKDHLERDLKAAVAFRDRYKVPVYCGEFGVYNVYTNQTDRYQWHRDITSLFQKYQIGYAVWEYRGAFGLIPYDPYGPNANLADPPKTVDPVLVKAIGLEPKSP